MNTNLMHEIAAFRTLIGYLGESGQGGWWASSFYADMSAAFLTPVFAKTHPLARFTGVSVAAAAVHDDRIGIGQVYHLFRLPEHMEASLHQIVQTPGFQHAMVRHLADRESALAQLHSRSAFHLKTTVETVAGPIWVGTLDHLGDRSAWAGVAAHYHAAFGSKIQVYPYFSNG